LVDGRPNAPRGPSRAPLAVGTLRWSRSAAGSGLWETEDGQDPNLTCVDLAGHE